MKNIQDIHREIHFETEIVNHLLNNGWIGGEANSKAYNSALALLPGDAIEWLKYAYPKEWEKLVLNYKSTDAAAEHFITKLSENLDTHGTLEILRKGFKIVGTGKTEFAMASFKPAFGHNPEEMERYSHNRCRVLRQVHYSPHRTAESIDLVLFLNGIPLATFELKTDSTQSVHDAILQFQKDRPLMDPTNKKREPLLQFKVRCLVHFAVSTDEVYMATRLNGYSTYFMPFNLGYNEGKGNPPNPNGIKTSYLWEKVLDRDNWMHIVGNFVHLEVKKEKDDNGKELTKETLIFPRYHQWDAVLAIVAKAKEEGAGKKYLIQHSAGSGKSNSIAWLAHHLCSLHRMDKGIESKVFDSVIVITDRTVLDDQLQATVKQFSQTEGVVETITTDEGSKSENLSKALLGSKNIIVVTIQTFGFVLKHLASNESLAKRRYAIIADEAHTSQTGSTAAKVKKSLGYQEDDELSAEDLLLAEMEMQAGTKNLSYFAFTATPKAKTLELFGRRDENGILKPFHSYSMQQAIEEKYILDVLQNYISYKVAWKLAHNGKEYDEKEVDESEATKKLVKWVRLHPHNIAQKVAIIVEHFREHVAHRLNGQAKAMVVTASRQEVVRFKLAIDKYIYEKQYNIATLVAFSGEVEDKTAGIIKVTEKSMNPDLKGRDLPKAFDTDEFQILLVANKYQTGFDQKKLVAMYVDKKLGGVATVQTLSRLNRVYPPLKDWTVVLDFCNDPQQILEDFQVYYRSAKMPGGSDPELLLKLQRKLDDDGFYLASEVEAFFQFYWSATSNRNASELHRLITPPIQRIRDRVKTAKLKNDQVELTKISLIVKDVGTFCKLYEFLGQIINYEDTDLAKRYAFFKHLLHPLKEILKHSSDDRPQIDLAGVKLIYYSNREKGKQDLKLDSEKYPILEGNTASGTGLVNEPSKAYLTEIIQNLNKLFDGELTETDIVNYATGVRDKLLESKDLELQAANNNKNQFALGGIRDIVANAMIEHRDANNKMAGQILADEYKLKSFIEIMVDMAWQGFESRRLAG